MIYEKPPQCCRRRTHHDANPDRRAASLQRVHPQILNLRRRLRPFSSEVRRRQQLLRATAGHASWLLPVLSGAPGASMLVGCLRGGAVRDLRLVRDIHRAIGLRKQQTRSGLVMAGTVAHGGSESTDGRGGRPACAQIASKNPLRLRVMRALHSACH